MLGSLNNPARRLAAFVLLVITVFMLMYLGLGYIRFALV